MTMFPPRVYLLSLVGVAVLLPGAARSDETAGPDGVSQRYYFAFDESSLRRDIARIHNFYVEPVTLDPVGDESSDLVFLGGVAGNGFVGFWDPGDDLPPMVYDRTGSWFNRVELGFGWYPELTVAEEPDARAVTRSLAGLDTEKVGVRADLTALFRDDPRSGAGASAWKVTGMLGATSLSLAPGGDVAAGLDSHTDNLLWDVGIGWSSGPISLSAGYQSIYSAVPGEETGVTANRLSVGADYVVVPGFSVYGEFNVVDDPAVDGEERLGTIVVVGTGLNF